MHKYEITIAAPTLSAQDIVEAREVNRTIAYTQDMILFLAFTGGRDVRWYPTPESTDGGDLCTSTTYGEENCGHLKS